MNPQKPLLALDFDGVICDSSEEILQTALAAWTELFQESRLPEAINKDDEARQAFEHLVPLGNRAEDFGVALFTIANRLEVVSQNDYDRVRNDLGANWLQTFHDVFYTTRDRIRLRNVDCWLSLHSVYRPFIDVLCKHYPTTTLSIATAKDGESVRRLLKHFRIDHLFDDWLILDKETGVSKTAHLHALADRAACELRTITFIDDKLNHLAATKPLGVRGVLAAWGHNTAKEHQAARDAGFAVATLEDVDSIISRR